MLKKFLPNQSKVKPGTFNKMKTAELTFMNKIYQPGGEELILLLILFKQSSK